MRWPFFRKWQWRWRKFSRRRWEDAEGISYLTKVFWGRSFGALEAGWLTVWERHHVEVMRTATSAYWRKMTVGTLYLYRVDCIIDIRDPGIWPGRIAADDTAITATRPQLQNTKRTVRCSWREIWAEHATAKMEEGKGKQGEDEEEWRSRRRREWNIKIQREERVKRRHWICILKMWGRWVH